MPLGAQLLPWRMAVQTPLRPTSFAATLARMAGRSMLTVLADAMRDKVKMFLSTCHWHIRADPLTVRSFLPTFPTSFGCSARLLLLLLLLLLL
jgi:hypothetical protein